MPKPYSKSKGRGSNVIYVGYMCRGCNTARLRRYRLTEVGRANTNKAIKKSISKHRHKQNARQEVHRQIRLGKISRSEVCVKCLKKKLTEAHHEDYSKPLDVIWLCRQCHFSHSVNS